MSLNKWKCLCPMWSVHEEGAFFHNQIFKKSKPQLFPSPGDLGCGRPAQGEVELPWCLHPSLLLPGELQSIMIMILMFMVMMTTYDLRISCLSRRLVYIVPNSPTSQVYVGGAPRTGNHGARPGSPPRLYQLVRIGIVGVLFSHFHRQSAPFQTSYFSNSRNWNISSTIDHRHLFLQTMLVACAGWAVNDLKKLNIIRRIWPFSQNIRKPKSNPNLGELHCRQSHLANSRAGESEQSPHIKVGIYLLWTLSS